MGDKQALGRAGEDAAARYYEHLGYRVVDRNWRVREGEIDLICARGGTIVFCEVKTRSTRTHGSGFEAVGARKQQRLRALAARWLQASTGRYPEVRFDVADVDGAGHVVLLEGCF